MNNRTTEPQYDLSGIIKSAQQNESFKTALIAEPRKCIENELGIKLDLPQGHDIVVDDQTDTSFIYLNIPPMPNLDNLELSDEDLEQVSGGSAVICYAAGAAIVGAVTYGVSYVAGRVTAPKEEKSD